MSILKPPSKYPPLSWRLRFWRDVKRGFFWAAVVLFALGAAMQDDAVGLGALVVLFVKLAFVDCAFWRLAGVASERKRIFGRLVEETATPHDIASAIVSDPQETMDPRRKETAS